MSPPGRNKVVQSFNEAHAGDITIRPPRSAASKRSAPYSIRFDETERARLIRDAKGMSWAAHIRRMIFPDTDQPRMRQTRKRRAPELDHVQLAKVLGSLGQSRLSSNLNQIAKAVNMGALPVSPELEQELHEACRAIQQMRHDLIEALGIKAQ